MRSGPSSDARFIERLYRLVIDNLSDENFGVKELVHTTGKSRSQIHRRLKSIKGQSISQFIREIRLNKAKEMLKNEEKNVAEIAYDVGFSSPSYFNKCYHDYFGYPPGETNNQVSEDHEDEQRDEKLKLHDFSKSSSGMIKTDSQNKTGRKLVFRLIGLLALVFLAVFIYKFFPGKDPITDKSIAVLPFVNLSNDTKLQFLADGLTEDLRTRLAQITSLNVKSQISSEKFRDSKMTAPEIARELGVYYLLAGSIMPDKEDIRINVQLISAEKDNHEWADIFDRDLKGVHEFITAISRQLIEKIEVVITQDEALELGSQPTQVDEAYYLYKTGRHFWNLRKKEEVYTSIRYFYHALECDSNFALAYAGLADAYQILGWFNWEPKEEAFLKGKEFAFKALDIDKDLAEAHATLGSIFIYYDCNWEQAEKELLKAIEQDPNYATAHQFYSEYLDIMGRWEEAHKHIAISLELNPYCGVAIYLSNYYYYKEGHYEEVIRREIGHGGSWISFRAYVMLGKEMEAVELMQQLVQNETGEAIPQLSDIYEKSGFEGVIKYNIRRMQAEENIPLEQIGESFALLKDKNLALEYLEKAYDNGRNPIPRIKYDPAYKFLHTEPRFIALLKKMNLDGY